MPISRIQQAPERPPRYSPRRRLAGALTIFILALLVRFAVWSEMRGTVLDEWHLWDQTDMSSYLEQSRRIAAGDWLARDPYHPYHLWQRFAPRELWETWFLPEVFHEAPAYSYLLAAARTASAHPVALAKIVQSILGAVSCVFLFLIGEAAFGSAVGNVAGLILALYGPLLYIELQLLKEGWSIFLMLGCLLVFCSALGSALEEVFAVRAKWKVFAAGAISGLLYMSHEAARVVIAAIFASTIVIAAVRMPRRLPSLLTIFVAGLFVGFLPLAARNGAADAPIFAVSTRSAIVFAMSNDARAPEGGSRWGIAAPGLADLMEQWHGTFLDLIGAVIRTYHGDAILAFKNWFLKFRALCAVHEAADNTSYGFSQSRVPLLNLLPGFWLIFAPGIAGALHAAVASARNLKARRENAGPEIAAVILLFQLAALGGALTFVHSIGRLRLLIVPFLSIFAAHFFVELWQATRSRSGILWRKLAPVLTLLALAAGFQAYAQTKAPPRFRVADFVVAANLERTEGKLDEAVRDYSAAIELGSTDPAIYHSLALLLWREGRFAEASARLSDALHLQRDHDEKEFAPLKQSLALLLASCPDASVRDGHRALVLARELDESSHHQSAAALDALAAAQAEMEEFTEAEASAKQAINLAREAGQAGLADEIAGRLKYYEQKKPWRFGIENSRSPL